MTKPEWLIQHEKEKAAMAKANHCFDCIHKGEFHHWTKHCGKGRYAVHECAIHPGCMNTEFSIGCDDFKKAYNAP